MFVFLLVLALGLVLGWAFWVLWSGVMRSFNPAAYAYSPAAAPTGAASPSVLRTAPPAPSEPPQIAPDPTAPAAAPASAPIAEPSGEPSAEPASEPAIADASPPYADAYAASSASPFPSAPASDGGAAPAATPDDPSPEPHAAHSAPAPDASTAPAVGPAATGAPDNLRRMIGIGPANERHLNGLGITTFEQIAAWTPEDVTRVEKVLAFDGRIARERWVEQARLLAAGDTAEFLRRFPQAGKEGNS